MRSKFLLPFMVLFILSCSDDEQEIDVVPESPESAIDWCLQGCSSNVSSCFAWANENRAWRLNDCESIGTIAYRDVYCTVIIGYDDVPVYSPEGELIRWDRVPIYGQQVCGQESYRIRTPAQTQQYNACRADAQQEFIDAMDSCESKYIACQSKCDKPDKPPRIDPPDGPSNGF